MPRAALLSVDEAVQLLMEYADHFQTANLPAYSSQVWKDMSNGCHGKWTPNNVYVNVTQDRRQILTKMREKLKINVTVDENHSNRTNITDTSAECSRLNISITSDDDPDYKKKPDFVLLLESECRASLGPISCEYERTYVILEPNFWTDVIFDEFHKQFRLPCAYSFKRAKIHPSTLSEYYLRMEGRCKDTDCGNRFIGFIDKMIIEKADVEVNIYTNDTSQNKNHKLVKRTLKGRKCKRVAQEVIDKGVTGWRKERTRKNMQLGDVEPPNLYNADTLRQAKREKLDDDFGVTKEDARDVVKALDNMKHNPIYGNSIKDTGSDRFFVFYGLSVQTHIYKEYIRLRRHSAFVCMDATGGAVKTLIRGKDKRSASIFLYSVVINFDGVTTAVWQMLLERHDNEFITLWLKQWLRQGVPIPPETVCDYSKALLNAISFSFNQQGLKAYCGTALML